MALTRPRAYQIYDIDYKQATRVVTVSNITLSGGAPNAVDGVNLSLNDRVLVTGQSTASQNGIYYVTTVGTGSNGTWARSVDTNNTGEILSGTVVMVTEGTVFADTQWKLITDGEIIVGTTAQVWTQNYLANSISSGTSNIVVNANANVTVSSAGTANVLTVSSTGTVVSGTASATGNITGGNLLTTGLISSNVLSATGNAYVGAILTNNYYYANGVVFGGGGGGTPGGANTQIQFNDNGAFAATAGLTFNKTSNAVIANGNITGGNLLTTGIVSATGNITGSYIIGNGSQLTGLPAGYTNSNLATLGSNVISTTGTITGGNISGSNLLTAGLISAAGTITSAANITGGNVTTGGLISATGNITGGNILGGANVNATTHTGTTVSVSANITGGNILTAGLISATSTITSASTITGSTLLAGGISLTGNSITSANATITIDPNSAGGSDGAVIIAGNLSVTGNMTYINSNNITTNDLTINMANNAGTAAAANGGGIEVGPAGAPYITLTYNSTSNIWVASNGLSVQGISSATGNITGGNILTAGLISATGNITGGNILGGANVNATTHTGTTVSVSANITGGNVLTAGLISATGTITSAGNLSLTGNIVDIGELWINTSANGNINLNPNGTGTTNIPVGVLSVTGNIQGGNLRTAGLISATGQVTGSQFNGSGAGLTSIPNSALANTSVTVNGTSIALGGSGTVTANAATLTGTALNATVVTSSLTSVGTLGSLAVTANITGGNLLTGGLISATGNVSGGNLNVTGNIVDTGALSIITGTNGNITLSPNGTGNINTSANIMPTANATANIGSATLSYNTIFAKATSAQYADLAEMYCADAKYAPGTVVEFGGNEEITISGESHSTRVAGIISTNPSYLMNSALDCTNALEVALVGRVPCRVVGTIYKGDRLVASGVPGVATVLDPVKYQPGCIIGKALEAYDSIADGIIEVAVGRT